MTDAAKCCPDHWAAKNRADMRKADRTCTCRGTCGCRKQTLSGIRQRRLDPPMGMLDVEPDWPEPDLEWS